MDDDKVSIRASGVHPRARQAVYRTAIVGTIRATKQRHFRRVLNVAEIEGGGDFDRTTITGAAEQPERDEKRNPFPGHAGESWRHLAVIPDGAREKKAEKE